MKAVVAGGGIGGLTAALALIARGWDVTVLERAAALEPVGAGLQISPNAFKVLDALGLGEAVRAVAFEPEALEIRMGKSGKKIASLPVGRVAEERWGAPYLHVHRADLQTVLQDALPDGRLRLGATVESYLHEGNRVAVRVGDERIEADLLVAADGLHSAIRAQMLGGDKPRFTGNVAWRAVVPMDRLGEDVPPPTACVWAGPHRHGVTYRLRRGELANFVGVVESAVPPDESWDAEGSREQALADFDGFQRPVMRIIEEADSLNLWALYDRPPLPRWSDGAVALLGDASHPTMPSLAQGAAMAIEDGFVLAREVSQGAPIATSLHRYLDLRLPRVTRVQRGSARAARTFHKATPLSQAAAYAPLWFGATALPKLALSRYDWLYGHDVTG